MLARMEVEDKALIPYTLFVEMQISTTTMDINMEVPQNAKNRAII
jgi:hypothetical protein